MKNLTWVPVYNRCRQILSKLYFAYICGKHIFHSRYCITQLEMVGVLWDSSNPKVRNLLKEKKH